MYSFPFSAPDLSILFQDNRCPISIDHEDPSLFWIAVTKSFELQNAYK